MILGSVAEIWRYTRKYYRVLLSTDAIKFRELLAQVCFTYDASECTRELVVGAGGPLRRLRGNTNQWHPHRTTPALTPTPTGPLQSYFSRQLNTCAFRSNLSTAINPRQDSTRKSRPRRLAITTGNSKRHCRIAECSVASADASAPRDTMARSPSPPDSPLSSMASSDAFDDEAHDFDDNSSRPSKRLKVENASRASSAVANEGDPEAEPVPEDIWENYPSVSSDTSGDIPSSPINARLDEEDFQDQVTICDWDGCDAGDQGNMDNLVEHIHNSHIESRQKKYTCEWKSCNRKGMAHASGYALKAHMRSHTREKPFYCYLPGMISASFCHADSC